MIQSNKSVPWLLEEISDFNSKKGPFTGFEDGSKISR
jgi:hypothetical protein